MNIKSIDWTLASILGAVVFLVCLICFGMNFFISIIIGGMLFVVGALVFNTKSTGELSKDDDLKKTLIEGKIKVMRILKLSSSVKNPKICEKIKNLCNIADQIIKEVERDPSDLSRSKQFFNYYLVETERLINKYIILAGNQLSSKEIYNSVMKMESTFDLLEDGYGKILVSLLDNDVMDIDAMVEVLKNELNTLG
jgi:5-bromo-4-chloroindolyl phosphate hydrolysis protein